MNSPRHLHIALLLVFLFSGCQIFNPSKKDKTEVIVENTQTETSDTVADSEPSSQEEVITTPDAVNPERETLVIDEPVEEILPLPEYIEPLPEIKPIEEIAPLETEEKKPDIKKRSYPIGVIGQTEPVVLYPAQFVMKARIDTGATTSSLDARNVTFFERDGDRWVRFTVLDRSDGREFKMERPVHRMAYIKQHEVNTNLRRAVVEITISLGSRVIKREFTLTDRSRFKCPILIARNVLVGEAIVDVSKEYTLKPEIIDEQQQDQ